MITPVGKHTGTQAADGVADDGGAGELTAFQIVHHGHMGAQIAAPAHTHGCKNSHIVGIGQSFVDKVLRDTDGGAGGTQRGDGHRNAFGAGETEQGHENEFQLFTDPGQQGDAFVGGTCEAALGGGVGEHHDHGADNEHAGDNAQTHFHTAFAAAQQGVQKAGANAPFPDFTVTADVQRLVALIVVAWLGLAVDLSGTHQHQAGADDAAHNGTKVADQNRQTKALAGRGGDTRKKGGDDQTHAESGADIAQGGELVLFEIAAEIVVIGQCQNGRIVGKIGSKYAHSAGTGQAIDDFYHLGQQFVQQRDHAEF